MVGLVEAISAVEAAVMAVPSDWSALDGTVVRDLNAQLLRVESRLAAVRLAAVRRLDELDVARTEGATSTGALLARGHGGDRAGQERFVRLAQSLTRSGAVETESLLASAELTTPQAEVIARSLAALPEEATDSDRRRAEKVMLEAAGRLRLPDLRRRGERLADTMRSRKDAEAEFDEQLERQERTARQRALLRLWDDPDGVVSHGRFTIPKAQADMLRGVLQGLSAPRRKHLTSGGVVVAGLPVTPEHRDGVAFTDLLSRMPTDRLPQHGGAASTVAVTIDLESLTGELRRSGSLLGSGTPLSSGQIRLMACGASILPIVLGGASVPLDLGRSERLFSKAQRLALTLRDGGCTFPDCDRPPAWTEVHHINAWARGGHTDADNGALVCPVHHHLIDTQGWQLRVRGGRVEYRKPGTDQWLVNDRYGYRSGEGGSAGVRHRLSDHKPGHVLTDEPDDLFGPSATSACSRRARSVTVRVEAAALAAGREGGSLRPGGIAEGHCGPGGSTLRIGIAGPARWASRRRRSTGVSEGPPAALRCADDPRTRAPPGGAWSGGCF